MKIAIFCPKGQIIVTILQKVVRNILEGGSFRATTCQIRKYHIEHLLQLRSLKDNS